MTNPLRRATDAANLRNKEAENIVDKAKRVDSQIATRFSEIRRMRDKIPADLGNQLFKIVYLPVVALFANRNFTDPRVLGDAGFQTYQFPGDDLKDYPILANQAILLIDFSKFNQMYADKKKEDNGSNIADHKEALADWKESYAAWEARVAESEEAVNTWFEKKEGLVKRKKKYEDYLQVASSYSDRLKQYELDVKEFKAGNLKVRPIKPLRPLEVKPPKELPPKPTLYDPDGEFKPERPKPLKRTFNVDMDDMAEVVVELTRDLKDLLNVDYVLVSAQHRVNPKTKEGNIICFWLVERWKHKKLETKGRVAINSWNFAFE